MHFALALLGLPASIAAGWRLGGRLFPTTSSRREQLKNENELLRELLAIDDKAVPCLGRETEVPWPRFWWL
jgi:hypothetical protein